MTKEGYQPIKKETIKIIPPNTGSHVHMKKEGYTWEDLDKSYWEGFDSAKNKMEKRIAELEKENAELKNQLEMSNKVYNDNLDYSYHIEGQLTKAKEIIRMVIDSYKHKERFSFEKDLIKAETFLKEVSE